MRRVMAAGRSRSGRTQPRMRTGCAPGARLAIVVAASSGSTAARTGVIVALSERSSGVLFRFRVRLLGCGEA